MGWEERADALLAKPDAGTDAQPPKANWELRADALEAGKPEGHGRGDGLFQADPSPSDAVTTTPKTIRDIPGMVKDAAVDTANGVGRGVLAAGDLASPISKTGSLQVPFGQLADPSYRREVERGVGNVVTGGLANKAANAVDPDFKASESGDKKAAPYARDLGETAGAFLPNPLDIVAPVGKAVASRAAEAAGKVVKDTFSFASDIAPKAVKDAGTAAKDLATAPVNRLADAQPGMLAKDIVGTYAGPGGKANATAVKKLFKADAPVKELLATTEGKQIAKVAYLDPGEAMDVVEKRLAKVQEHRADDYATILDASGGMDINKLVTDVENHVRTSFKDPGHGLKENAFNDMLDDIRSKWLPEAEARSASTPPTLKASRSEGLPPYSLDNYTPTRQSNEIATAGRNLPKTKDLPYMADDRVAEVVRRPETDVRAYVTRLQDVADKTMGSIEPSKRYELREELAQTVKASLDKHLDEVAKHSPEAQQAVDRIRYSNRKVWALLTVQNALKTRVEKEAAHAMGGGAVHKGIVGLAGVHEAMPIVEDIAAGKLGHAAGRAASVAALAVAPRVVHDSARALSAIAVAIRSGDNTATKAAIAAARKSGIPSAAINDAVMKAARGKDE